MLSELVWMNRNGKVIETVGDPALFSSIGLSPDEKTAAVIISEASGVEDIWLIDLERSLRTRFTFSDQNNAEDVSNLDWSPDGRHLAYGTNPEGSYDIYIKSVSGTGEPELIRSEKEDLWVYHWSPDGKWIGYTRSLSGSEDAFAVAVDGDPSEPVTLLDGPYNEWPVRFSPNMRWIAYCSDESGRREIYIKSFPDLESRWQVSISGGDHPLWRRDGEAIFFLSPAGMLTETPVEEVEDGLRIGDQQVLFETGTATAGEYTFAPSGSGDRFLVIRSRDRSSSSRLSLIMNWTELLPAP